MAGRLWFRLACTAAVTSLMVMPAVGVERDTADAGDSRVYFPVVIAPPAPNGGQTIKSGEAILEQSLRSLKAVRLSESYTFRYEGWNSSPVTMPAGTMLVLARVKDSDMYCTAATEGEDGLIRFYDVGYCARDDDGDGIFDKELVIEQRPWRVRIAYEIVGTDQATWRKAKLPYQPVPETAIPPVRVKFSYRSVVPGGLFSSGKPMPVCGASLFWPTELIPEATRKAAGTRAEFIVGSFRSEDFNGNEPLVCRDLKKKDVEYASPPFAFKVHGNPDESVDATVTSSLAPGPAVLAIAGRVWTVNDYRAQGTIMRLIPLAAR